MGKSSGPSPPAVQALPAPQPLAIPQFSTDQQQATAPTPVPLPAKIERVTMPDFKTRQEQLHQKAKADYITEQARKKTRQSTVKTTSLLDEEPVTTTGLLDS